MKCTITIQDDDLETNTCTIKVDFEPPIEQDAPGTAASHLAMKMLEVASDEIRRLKAEETGS